MSNFWKKIEDNLDEHKDREEKKPEIQFSGFKDFAPKLNINDLHKKTVIYIRFKRTVTEADQIKLILSEAKHFDMIGYLDEKNDLLIGKISDPHRQLLMRKLKRIARQG